MSPLEYGLIDILTFNCGRRPLMTEADIAALVLKRFEWSTWPDQFTST